MPNGALGVEARGLVGTTDEVHRDPSGREGLFEIPERFLASADHHGVHLEEAGLAANLLGDGA